MLEEVPGLGDLLTHKPLMLRLDLLHEAIDFSARRKNIDRHPSSSGCECVRADRVAFIEPQLNGDVDLTASDFKLGNLE